MGTGRGLMGWVEMEVNLLVECDGVWDLRCGEKDSGGPRGALQIPPLRYAPVGMTKGGAVLPFGFDIGDGEQQVPCI